MNECANCKSKLEAAEKMAGALEQYTVTLEQAASDYQSASKVFENQGWMNARREAIETCAYIRAILKGHDEALSNWQRVKDGVE